MDLKLKGKNALVCASSAGIGKGIAKDLISEGVNVSLLGRDAERLEKAKKELETIGNVKIIATICDLAREKDIAHVFKKTISNFGRIDILVNNQGGPAPGTFEEIDAQQTQDAININLVSVLRLSRLCLEHMKSNKWGRIINILSISAKEPIAGLYLSNLVRPAVLGFAKTVALEYAPYGITINSLLPSAVLSDRTSYFVQQNADKNNISFKDALKNISSSLPMKYIATPEEFARLSTFLCSPLASYITGTAIAVDGGTSKSLY
jgi:3-oxoacyl-[acyl-carrier protein] reductase